MKHRLKDFPMNLKNFSSINECLNYVAVKHFEYFDAQGSMNDAYFWEIKDMLKRSNLSSWIEKDDALRAIYKPILDDIIYAERPLAKTRLQNHYKVMVKLWEKFPI